MDPGPQARRRVLVVDDHADGAEMLATLLRVLGHATFTAGSAAEAIAAARAFRPDVVLLDLALPDASGFSVAQALRRDAATAGARIVGLTGFDTEAHRRKAAECGLDAYEVKPVLPERLSAILAG